MIKGIIKIGLVCAVFALAACVGGTSTPDPTAGAPAAATSVNMTVSGKSLNFSWTAGSNVNHYRISENPDGASGFTVVASASAIASTATAFSIEIPVHKTNWLAAQYILEACNADESTCVSSPNQTLALIDSVAATIYVKASNTGVNDSFGWSVSLSGDGNTLAVGAYLEDSIATGIGGNQADNAAIDSGAVYVFSRTGTTWTQQAYVKASNTGLNDIFGWSVSLSGDGNTLAVGACLEGSIATGIGGNQADNTASASGAVYVFSRTGTTWTQQAYVKASNTGVNDIFGWSVSLSGDGNTLAVAARGEDSSATGIGGNQADNAASNAGAVYVFSRTGTTWTQQAYVKASNTEASDNFGYSVSLSGDGNTLAVSGYLENSIATGIGGNQVDNTASASGAVYVFSRTGTTWTQQAYVKASNTGSADIFGYSVSLSDDGNTLAVGTYGEDSIATGIGGNQADNTAGNAGAVYLY
ncbi:MAG: FG-GAP repeat protein [Ghiorsea sp.]|nr:FG-GAP repeat protein [Ghiorsea sp.]